MPQLNSWAATLVDGRSVSSAEVNSFERVVEAGGCRLLEVRVEGHAPVHVSCVPEHGESIRLFTRRGIIWPFTGGPELRVDMPVIEVRRADGTYSRIYFHPTHGQVFSTLDLNL